MEMKIDLVILANDARTLTFGELPIVASTDGNVLKDYDQYSVDEIMELDEDTLMSLSSFYALDTVAEAINTKGLDYTLTKKQEDLLESYYNTRASAPFELNVTNISEFVEVISDREYVHGPGYVSNQPENNYAQLHGLKMVGDDYLAIIKTIIPNEFIGMIEGPEKDRLGVPIYAFKHNPKDYVVKYSGQTITSDILICIKLILDYEENCNIAIISFHDWYHIREVKITRAREFFYKENLKKIPQDMIHILEKFPPNDILGDVISRVPGNGYIYDDIHVVYVRFLPVYVPVLPKTDYWDYMVEDIEEDPLDELWEHLAYDVMEEHCVPGFYGSLKYPDGFLEYDYHFKHNCFRLVIVQERSLSQDPIYKDNTDLVPEVIIANNNKIKDWEELEVDIGNWFKMIKEITDLSG